MRTCLQGAEVSASFGEIKNLVSVNEFMAFEGARTEQSV
jgi:hypothetical protein